LVSTAEVPKSYTSPLSHTVICTICLLAKFTLFFCDWHALQLLFHNLHMHFITLKQHHTPGFKASFENIRNVAFMKDS